MAYTDDHLAYINTVLRDKVRQALANICQTVYKEASTSNPETDSKRKAFALLVLNNIDTYIQRVTLAIVTDNPGTITQNSSDATIRSAVEAVFNTFAAV